MVREPTVELWSLLPCGVSWWCWERWCWKPSCHFALGHSSCETTTVTKCGLGGSELKCMNQVIMTESQAAFMEGANAENPSQSECCCLQLLWASLEHLQASPLCGNAIPSKLQALRQVYWPYPATVSCSCSLKASCSRCDYINIKMIKLQTTCHPCMHQFPLNFIHLSWKCI